MALDNQKIEQYCETLVKASIAQSHMAPKQAELDLIIMGTALVVNVLQNINDIAYYACNVDQRADRQ